MYEADPLRRSSACAFARFHQCTTHAKQTLVRLLGPMFLVFSLKKISALRNRIDLRGLAVDTATKCHRFPNVAMVVVAAWSF
jgi:hypothetical protein